MFALTPLLFALFLPFSLLKVLDTNLSRPVLPPHQEVNLQIPVILEVKPTLVPTPTPSVVPTPTPSPSVSIRSLFMSEINHFRKSKGLTAISTDPYTCSFADIRAREISTGFNHDGFTNRINSHTLPYPSYHYVVENLAQTGDFKNVVNMWINSSGHAQNLLADVTFGCTGNYGNYYVYEGWKP